MIVFIVSECHGKARERSQRTLDAFLPRIGRRSWSGRISEEGLERLRKELKGEASRSSAIACHRVRGHTSVKIAWRIGSRSAFDELGRVPVSIKSGPMIRGDRRLGAARAYLKAIVVLAALLHDVGKASKAFQKKLSSAKPLADPVRHELLSVYAVLAAIEDAIPDLAARQDKDIAVVDCFATGTFLTHLDRVLASDRTRTSVSAILSGAMVLPTSGKHGQVLTDLCHLILTHHRLASSVVADGSNSIQAKPWAHLRGGREHDPSEILKGCAFEAGSKAFGSSDEVKRWSHALKESGTQLGQSLIGPSAPSMPRGTVQHNGRLALMLGDHHASAIGNMASRTSRVKGLLYANTPSDPGEVRDARGQTIARHLVSVASASSVASDALFRLLDDLPALVGDEVPEGIQEPSSAPGRFAWQARAKATVSAARKPENDRGFLAFVMAATGAGKTRAIPSILVASRPEAGLRYSIGLGLRSLTLQTANEYTSRLGFHRSGVSVALGSSLARRLDALRRKLDQATGDKPVDLEQESPVSEASVPVVSPGTDAEEEDVGIVESLEGDAPVLDLPPLLLRMNAVPGRRASDRDMAARAFLASPILVSTLDQLMPVATSTRGGHLTAALRVATSDLVIDEIDDFQPEDVAAICRLVEHAASFGRHAVVSSATLPPAVAAAIHRAYAHGWSRHSALAGVTPEVEVAWLTDAPDGCRTAIPGIEGFGQEHAITATLVATHAGSLPWKRRLGFYDGESDGGASGFRQAASEAISVLHSQHHAVDPSTGRKVSTGVIRLANVRPAMDMALHLLSDGIPSGPDVLVVPYVGTLLPAVRFKVEGVLDRLLGRSGTPDPLFTSSSPIRGRLDDGRGTDLCVVVVTTSLEETGRDHDFDWAIVEPGSARGLVQLAGRVRRHRPPPATDAAPNILMPRHCLRSVENPSERRPFSRPGIETDWKNAHGRSHGPDPLTDHEASLVYAGEGWDRSITAASLVSPDAPGSLIAAFERKRWEGMLLEDGGDGLGPVRSRDLAYVCDAHQRWRRFRRQDGPQAEFRLETDGWHLVDDDGVATKVESRAVRLAVPDESRLLVHVDVAAVAADLLSRIGASENERILREMLTVSLSSPPTRKDWKLMWHPALGSAVASG